MMFRKIADQLTEGDYEKAKGRFLDYLCLYGTAVMRGPVPRVKRRQVREKTKSGVWSIRTEERTVLSFEAISPFDCYPAPDSREIGDGPLVIKTRFSPSDLRLFSKAKGRLYKGWNADAVNRILAASPQGGIELSPTAVTSTCGASTTRPRRSTGRMSPRGVRASTPADCTPAAPATTSTPGRSRSRGAN